MIVDCCLGARHCFELSGNLDCREAGLNSGVFVHVVRNIGAMLGEVHLSVKRGCIDRKIFFAKIRYARSVCIKAYGNLVCRSLPEGGANIYA